MNSLEFHTCIYCILPKLILDLPPILSQLYKKITKV